MIVVAVICIGVGVLVLEVDVHVPLVFSVAFACLMGRYLLHIEWKEMEDGIFRGILAGLQAILILTIVGMIIGSWIQGGIVPTLIYYGLSILSPNIFLLATLLICSIVSLATGTSWDVWDCRFSIDRYSSRAWGSRAFGGRCCYFGGLYWR